MKSATHIPAAKEAFVVRVQFPWQRRPVVPIEIDVTHDELVRLAAPAMPVLHAHDEPRQLPVDDSPVWWWRAASAWRLARGAVLFQLRRVRTFIPAAT